MTYEEVIEKIHSFTSLGIKPGLERIKILLDIMGNPQDKVKFIHVAGTNGKGSICTMISSVMKECGYRAGLFISPSVIDFRERIQINGIMISKCELIEIAQYIFEILNSPKMKNILITEFELVTSIAFEYFFRRSCDIVILETGLGGRLDATNIIKNPLVSVITSISLDHTNILGDTIEDITKEKCGIIKESSIVVSYPRQDKRCINVILEEVKRRKGSLFIPNEEEIEDVDSSKFEYTQFKYKNIEYKIPFIGDHQIYNSITAIDVLEVLNRYFNINHNKLLKGLEEAYIPARLETISKKPYILLDGAHNPSGARALACTLKKYFPGKKIIGIVGMLSDKDVKECLSIVLPLMSTVITVQPNNIRALGIKDITDISRLYCKDVRESRGIFNAIKLGSSIARNNEVVVIFGSLYLAGEVKDIFKNFT